MADHKQIRLMTESENNKPLFILGMLGIADYQCVLILKDCRGFLKRNTMLFPVYQCLLRIPFKMKHIHNYIINIRIVMSMALYEQCERCVNKAPKICHPFLPLRIYRCKEQNSS